jgi:hypothetical protein
MLVLVEPTKTGRWKWLYIDSRHAEFRHSAAPTVLDARAGALSSLPVLFVADFLHPVDDFAV